MEDPKTLQEFLAALPKAESLNLSPEAQQTYFELVIPNFILELVSLSQEVAKKGKEYPLFGEKKWHGVELRIGTPKRWGPSDYLSVGIDRFFQPQPLIFNERVVGNTTCQISVADTQRSVRFIVLDDSYLAFVDDNDTKEKPIVINTRLDLFGNVGELDTFFPVGTPATWLNKLLGRGIMQQFGVILSRLPARQ